MITILLVDYYRPIHVYWTIHFLKVWWILLGCFGNLNKKQNCGFLGSILFDSFIYDTQIKKFVQYSAQQETAVNKLRYIRQSFVGGIKLWICFATFERKCYKTNTNVSFNVWDVGTLVLLIDKAILVANLLWLYWFLMQHFTELILIFWRYFHLNLDYV